MAVEKRELYNSPNGDRWFLCRDPTTGEAFVQHEPNASSGGQLSKIEIGAFLNRGPRNPEHHALLSLMGALMTEPDNASERPKLFEDRQEPGTWRVEWTNDDGGCEVAIFAGPNARERAIRYSFDRYQDFEVISYS